MVLFVLILGYNFTYIEITMPTVADLSNYPGIKPYATKRSGNINLLQNLIHLYYFSLYNSLSADSSLHGDIGIVFINMQRLTHIWITGAYVYGNVDSAGITVTGNISVFGNKYNLKYIQFTGCKGIYGEVKSLKNLKKFYACRLDYCSCTGSKTDLYNSGANITIFSV